MPRLAATPGHRDGCTTDRHDTASAYRWGCRCPKAREQHRLYYKRRRQGRLPDASVDATGTIRRIEALHALGWRQKDIAAHLGARWQSVAGMRIAGRVYRSTADRIAQVYDRLSMTPGPSKLGRERALARGLVPPLAWDDETIDDPAAQPNYGPVRPRAEILAAAADRRAEVDRLDRAGLTIAKIAARLEIGERSVNRHLQAIRAAAQNAA
jgi:plasmid maintenance system antidote protein VapI